MDKLMWCYIVQIPIASKQERTVSAAVLSC